MDAKHTGKIYGINGPVIYLKGRTGFKMSEMVYVGEERLVGEVISLETGRDCGGYRRSSIRHPCTWNYQ